MKPALNVNKKFTHFYRLSIDEKRKMIYINGVDVSRLTHRVLKIIKKPARIARREDKSERKEADTEKGADTQGDR